jgi:hypothetical protein
MLVVRMGFQMLKVKVPLIRLGTQASRYAMRDVTSIIKFPDLLPVSSLTKPCERFVVL